MMIYLMTQTKKTIKLNLIIQKNNKTINNHQLKMWFNNKKIKSFKL